MSRFPVRGRRLCAVGIPILLFAVLVGCGQKNPEAAQQEAGGAPELMNDLGLDPNSQAALPEVARLDQKTVDENITQDNVGQPNVIPNPVGAIPGTTGDTGAMTGSGGNNGLMSGATSGRSGATKLRLLKEGRAGLPDRADTVKAGGEHNAQNAEAYGVYRENEFRSPLVAALSTFSADVNTASYSNVRRILNDGNLPPASAVFLAEFVNYFPYQYAQPKGDDPVAFHVEMGPCPWNRHHHLVRVGVQAAQIPADKMPARNLVFLIDTSGSMSAPNRLPLVKKSLELLVDKLTEKDRVSIVTYAGDSRVALAPTKGTEKKAILDVLTGLGAGGSTNGEGGIKKAYQLARDTFLEGGVNRVILCTDGDFNVGVTDNGDLVKLIEEQRRSRVFLTILGYGMGNYKDDRLKELANHGNGHHAYIDTIDEAKKVFVEQGGALVCVAKDVKFQVDFNPAKVNAYRLVGYENRLLKDEDFKNDAKDAGDLGSGHQVTVLYEIVPVGVKIDLLGVDPSKYQKPKEVPANVADEWLTVKMRYKHPDADTSKELAQPHKGAVAKDLSDDFRFAAATASFGMMLRDSKYRGAMTYAGVLEEAQGCLGADPNGHRKQFLELVKQAKELAAKVKNPDPKDELLGPLGGRPAISDKELRQIAETWGTLPPEKRAKIIEEITRDLPPKFEPMIKNYFDALDKVHGYKK